MIDIQKDVLSKGSTPLIPFLKSVKSNHTLSAAALEVLSKFDGTMAVDSSGALIFNAWADQLARRLFAPHLKEMFATEYGKKGLRVGLIHVVTQKIDFWCDRPETKEVESCENANQEAFDAALNYLSKRYGSNIEKWQWGEAHQAISEHRPLSRSGFIGRLFEISRPFPGDGFTVNVGRTGFENPNEPFATYNAASMRAIYDFSDLEKSQFIYQAGQSGWAHTPRYRQYATDWSKSQYLPLEMNPKSEPKRSLVLEPR
jgi:penicillin amidase